MSNLDYRKFLAPEIIFGNGSRGLCGQYIKNLGVSNALLVTDENVRKAKWFKDVEKSLEERNVKYTIFSEISPNPRDFQVMNGVEVYNYANLLIISKFLPSPALFSP